MLYWLVISGSASGSWIQANSADEAEAMLREYGHTGNVDRALGGQGAPMMPAAPLAPLNGGGTMALNGVNPDPYDTLYPGDYSVTTEPVVVGAAAAATLSGILRVAGALIGPILAMFRAVLGAGFKSGTRVIWSKMPAVLRSILMFMGIKEGTDIIIDMADGDTGNGGTTAVVPVEPGGPLVATAIPAAVGQMTIHGAIVKVWSNGVTLMGMTETRWMFALRKDATVKWWKPKKPVVLMPSGPVNVRSLVRADTIINRQLKKIRTAMRRRGLLPTARRVRSSGRGMSPTEIQNIDVR